LRALNVEADEISVHFVTQKKICDLHAEYFDDPTPTDTISFPLDYPSKNSQGHVHLGEVFVCPKTALEYVQKKGGDPYIETSLYLVHGILHLLGYDDLTPKERKEMRKQERFALKMLKSKKALLTSSRARVRARARARSGFLRK
jgi:probable rRNA maturation factor